MKIEEVNEMLNYMEREGKEETEPYKSYKSILDRVYNYLNEIYKGRKRTNEKYISSVKRLESECDRSKYICKNEREKKYEEEEENEVVDLKEKKEQQREQPREEKEKELM
jgi:hypothetical protein